MYSKWEAKRRVRKTEEHKVRVGEEEGRVRSGEGRRGQNGEGNKG